MKKQLAVLAMMATLGGSAWAQSNGVTLYGTLDTSVHSINNANSAGKNVMGLIDSSVASSVWGLRGSEDLGNGLRAVFNIEGDVQTNNGGTQTNGIFRRNANVGLADNKLGQLDLGIKVNPLIAAVGQVMPINSLSFHGSVVIGQRWPDFFTKNAVTYTSPRIAGLQVQGQYGASNTVDKDSAGSIHAIWANWRGGPITVNVATQNRNAGGSTSSANGTSLDKETWLYNVKYAVTDKFDVALAHSTNEAQTYRKVTSNWAGVGYKLTAATSVGLNYMRSDDDTTLTNLAVRHNLSPRTTLYLQGSRADNGSGTDTAVTPIFTNTGTSPATNLSGYSAVAGKVQTAWGAGIIHRF